MKTGMGTQGNECREGTEWDGWHNGNWDGDPMEQVLRGGRLGWGLMGVGREMGTRMKTKGNGC